MFQKRKKGISFFVSSLKIHSINRISLDFELHRQFKRLKPGITLDVGSSKSPYKKYIPHTKYMRLDSDEKTNPDICCDLHEIKWESDYFDTVIATEVLEHLYDPQRAINEIYRVLNPGGICILSTRFIYPYHPGPKDYYRFTTDSLNLLFKKFSIVEIYPHGNRIQVLWQIINNSGNSSCGRVQRALNVFLNILNPLVARINFKDVAFHLGFVVYLKK